MNYTQKKPAFNHVNGMVMFRLYLLAAVFVFSGCANFRACDDDWWGRDKGLHFAASAAIGAGVTWAALDNHHDLDAAAIGIAASSAVGAGKEWYDLSVKKTCWSWRDLVWDVFGASVGATVVLALD
jgi:putative lipoprotein